MIAREHLLNRLRALHYKHKRDTRNSVQLWGRGTHRIVIPKNQLVDPETVRSILRQCGMPEDDIQKFIGEYNRSS